MANPKTGGRKKRQVEAEGVAHIKATFNNTIITITALNGETVAWSSAALIWATPSASTCPAKNESLSP